MKATNDIIDWERFQSKFYYLEAGRQAEVILANWRQEERKFSESETPRTALVFDVIVDNGKELNPCREWMTTSPSLANEFRPMIEAAEQQGRHWVKVILKRTSEKKYIVIDISDREEQTIKKTYVGLKK